MQLETSLQRPGTTSGRRLSTLVIVNGSVNPYTMRLAWGSSSTPRAQFIGQRGKPFAGVAFPRNQLDRDHNGRQPANRSWNPLSGEAHV